ncbi:hypothetical protein KSX_71940 [Ktedonospora formicarum]|uniref:PDZ domain-containing protein n=1 Tax=Ktedonospora formicarum TaxID=2778364 RepID=A0A8J3MWI5_9CHLR|nr:hypothetical protein KSX_71940 [Ktedonospora formicarum]
MSAVSEKPTSKGETPVSLPNRQWWRNDGATLVRLLIVVGLIAGSFWYLASRAASPTVTGTSSCDARPRSFEPGATPAASSIHTIKQAYNCILDTYPTALDHRKLLQHAMSGMVNYLVQQHQDQRSAVLPALAGDRQQDWQAFEQTYATMTTHHSLNQQKLVAAAITEMVDGLHDNHAHYLPALPEDSQPGPQVGLGIRLSIYHDQFADALPPLYIQSIDPGSPAEQAGLRPGDTIVTVNGLPPFLNQKPVPEVMNQIFSLAPVQLQVQHPGSDEIISVHLVPASYPEIPFVSTRMLPGNILYIRLTAFQRGAADQIRSAVQQAGGTQLKGLVLDLRGNGGGK